MDNPEPWWVNESEESHAEGMQRLWDHENGTAFNATNGDFPAEEVTIEKMREAMAKMKAMTDDHHKQLGEALAKSGILVICDPTLKDHEFRVSPAIHAAALGYAVANRKDLLIHMPRPSALSPKELDSE